MIVHENDSNKEHKRRIKIEEIKLTSKIIYLIFDKFIKNTRAITKADSMIVDEFQVIITLIIMSHVSKTSIFKIKIVSI